MPYFFHALGRNCMGPTARSTTLSLSYLPLSVSLTLDVPAAEPSSRIPRIAGLTTPFEPIVDPPKRPWLLSTRPIPASTDQLRLQLGSVVASFAAASTYAW